MRQLQLQYDVIPNTQYTAKQLASRSYYVAGASLGNMLSCTRQGGDIDDQNTYQRKKAD